MRDLYNALNVTANIFRKKGIDRLIFIEILQRLKTEFEIFTGIKNLFNPIVGLIILFYCINKIYGEVPQYKIWGNLDSQKALINGFTFKFFQ